MNCLEFHRMLRTEPECRDAEFVRHKARCEACAREATRTVGFEQRLREAVEVPVPDSLISRVLLRHEFTVGREARPTRKRPSLAWAAGVVLAISLAMGGAWHLRLGGALDREVVALVNEAPYALQGTEPVSPGAVAAALQPVGLTLDGEVGEVTFASRCLVRGLLSGHLVLKGDTAPVTVFLIPRALVGQRSPVSSSTLAGVLLPVDRGTIAILGAPGERLADIERRVRSAVRWPA